MAVYPSGIKQFSTKNNLLDDVDAAHINEMQDEIAALQSVLGTMPAHDRTLFGVEKDWGTVAKRMADTQRGLHVPVVGLNVGEGNPVTSSTSTYKTIAFPKLTPPARLDPMEMSDGTGITLFRTGWWVISADVTWKNPNTTGWRYISLLENTAERVGSTDESISTRGTRQNLIYQGLMSKGNLVRLRAQQNSGTTQPLLNATLSATFIRDL